MKIATAVAAHIKQFAKARMFIGPGKICYIGNPLAAALLLAAPLKLVGTYAAPAAKRPSWLV